MDDRSKVLVTTTLGAAAGALLGFLYLTDRGRAVREQIEPRLDDFVSEMRRLRSTVHKARLAADEGLRSLNELVGQEA